MWYAWFSKATWSDLTKMNTAEWIINCKCIFWQCKSQNIPFFEDHLNRPRQGFVQQSAADTARGFMILLKRQQCLELEMTNKILQKAFIFPRMQTNLCMTKPK